MQVMMLIARTAAPQFGLINYTQLLAAGLSPGAIKRLVARGFLERLAPRVYRIAGSPTCWEQELMAATLWAQDDAAICGPPAAALWRLAGLPREGVELAVVGNKRHNGLPFRVHRVSEHLIREIVLVDNIPVTSVRRTLLDLAGIKHPRTGRALDDALFKKLTSLGEMWLLYEEEWTKGRRGIAILRELLKASSKETGPTQSDLEDLLRGIINDFVFPAPHYQYPLNVLGQDCRADAAYPDKMVWIECDSYAWHGNREAFERDRERDHKLKMLGWTVLRFTWAQLKFKRAYVAEVIRAHVS